MNKRIFLLFAISIFTFAGCETQVGTAIKHAGANLFNGNAFKHAFSGSSYKNLKEETEKARTTLPADSLICIERNAQPVLGANTLANLAKIKDQLCSCESWGTCDSQSCSCEKLCPKNFEILKRPTALDDSPENSLSFTNGDGDFYHQDPNYQGYCWGHALLTQRFNRLATFKKTSVVPYRSPEQAPQRIAEYKRILKKLNNNEPVDIPGFSNLLEFSSDPEVETLLKDSVKELWGQNAMSFQGAGMLTNSSPMKSSDFDKLVADVEERLKNHQAPTIVFNNAGDAANSHATIVSGIKTNPDGTKEICLRDNNYSPERVKDCKATMQKDPATGAIFYNSPLASQYSYLKEKVGKVVMAHSEDPNVVEQVKNLQKKCAQEKGCSN